MTRLLPVLLLIAPVFVAQAAIHNGRDVQGNAGWLHVRGSMQEPACRIDMASRYQSVTLPSVTTADFIQAGDRTSGTPFYIRLEGCKRSAGSVSDNRNHTMWSDWQPIVTLIFSGVADEQTPEIFKVKGAEGIGLRLQDARGNTLLPGARSHPQFLTTGDQMLYFNLITERTSVPLQAGSYQATIDFNMYYH